MFEKFKAKRRFKKRYTKYTYHRTSYWLYDLDFDEWVNMASFIDMQEPWAFELIQAPAAFVNADPAWFTVDDEMSSDLAEMDAAVAESNEMDEMIPEAFTPEAEEVAPRHESVSIEIVPEPAPYRSPEPAYEPSFSSPSDTSYGSDSGYSDSDSSD